MSVLRVVGSKVAVAFDAPPEKQGGVFICEGLQDHLRPQLGTVVACGPHKAREGGRETGRRISFPQVGTNVFVLHQNQHGTQITDPDGLPFKEVRIYGSFAEFQGQPQECGWFDSVVAGFEDMSWKAYGSNILIEPDERQDRIGSILLPDIAQRRTAMGVVRSVGSFVCDLKPGDKVCYDPHKCHPVQPCDDLGGLIPAHELAVEYVLPGVAA